MTQFHSYIAKLLSRHDKNPSWSWVVKVKTALWDKSGLHVKRNCYKSEWNACQWCLDHRELRLFTSLNVYLVVSSLGTGGEHTHTHKNTHGRKVGQSWHTTWASRLEENDLCHLETPVKIQRHKHNHYSSKCRHFYSAGVRGQAGCVSPQRTAWLVASHSDGISCRLCRGFQEGGGCTGSGIAQATGSLVDALGSQGNKSRRDHDPPPFNRQYAENAFLWLYGINSSRCCFLHIGA